MHKEKNKIIILFVVLGIISISHMLSGPYSVYGETVDRISVSVPQSCSVTTVLNQTHATEIQNGTYKSDIGETTIKLICNDSEGFSVYAIGYTNNELGKNVLQDSNVGDHNIGTGISESGPTSSWAMKLSSVSGAYSPTILSDANGSFESYHIIPDAYTKVATFNSSTDISIGASIKTTYAVYISKTQPAGTYEGKVKYVMVHPASRPAPYIPVAIECEAGKICYYPNSNYHDGTMGKQSTDDEGVALHDGSSVTLLASNYSQPEYGFAGWNDKHDYTGNFYGPNETITIPSGVSENGLSLYAVWVKSEGSFQDHDAVSSVCNSLTAASNNDTVNLSSVSALTDRRDNQTYAIAKLADGNCWMIENLRLNAVNSYNESLAQGFGNGATQGIFTGLANPETNNFNYSTESNSMYGVGNASVIDIGADDYPGYRIPRYSSINTNTRIVEPTDNSGQIYGYGNNYTWAAALANTLYYRGATLTDINGKTSETADTSICPNGWRLPYGRNTGNGASSGGFSYLDLQLGGTGDYQDMRSASDRWRKFPNNYVYAGFIYGDSAIYNGERGLYWTATAYDYEDSYLLYLSSTGVAPGTNYDSKSIGCAVRCMAG